MAEPDPNSAPAATPDKTKGRPRRRPRRVWRIAAWTGANLIGLVLLLLAALIFFTGPAIERLAPPLARQAGVPLDRLGGVDLSPPQIVLTDIVLADGAVTADRIAADWAGLTATLAWLGGDAAAREDAPGDDPDGQPAPALLTRLAVEGLALTARIDPDGGFTIPGLTPDAPAAGGGGIPLPPVAGPVAIEGAISLATPVGPVEGTVDLAGRMAGAGLSLSGPVAATLEVPADAPRSPVAGGGGIALGADLDLHLDAQGTVDALLTGLSGAGDAGPVTADLTDGWLSVARSSDDAPLLAAELSVGLHAAAGPAGDAPALRVDLSAMGPADPDALTGRATLSGPGGRMAIDRTAEALSVALGVADLGTFTATATRWADSFGVTLPMPPPIDPQGGVLDLSIDVATPAGLSGLLADPAAALEGGRFILTGRDLTGADARIAALSAQGRLVAEDGWRLIGTGTPWRVEDIRYGAAPPLSVALEGAATPQRLALGPDGRLTAQAGLYLSGPLGVAVAEVTAAFRAGRGTVTMARVETGPVRLGDVVARLSSPAVTMTVDPQTVSVSGPVAAALEPGRLGAVSWDAAGATGALEFTMADGAIAISATDPVSLALAGIGGPAGIEAAGPVTLSLTGSANLDPAGRLTVDAALTPPEEPISVESASVGTMAVTLPRIAAEAAGPLAGPIELSTRLEGGRLRAPGLTLSPLAATGQLTLDGADTIGSLSLPTLRADLAALPEPLAPLTLSGSFEMAEGALSGGARLRAGPLSVPLALHHGFDRGWGLLRVPETTVTVGPSGIALAEIMAVDRLPALIDPTAVRGAVTVGGVLRWAPSGVTEATASIALADGALTTPMPEVAGLTFQAEIDLLARRLIGQTVIAADLLAAKLEAEDVSLTVSQPTATEMRLEALSGTLAGGRLRIEPVTLPLDPLVGTVTLNVAEARLGRLLEIVPLDGLTATAPVSGSIPVQITGAGLRIAAAELAATEPGRLVYRPTERPGWADRNGSLTLLFDALEDFRFERLVATLAGDPLADLTLGLDVEGANPAVYGGYPIALGVNVEGPLMDILGRTVNLTLTEEQIRGLLEEGGTALPEDPP